MATPQAEDAPAYEGSGATMMNGGASDFGSQEVSLQANGDAKEKHRNTENLRNEFPHAFNDPESYFCTEHYCLVMVGLPAMGKTFVAHRLAKWLKFFHDVNVKYLNRPHNYIGRQFPCHGIFFVGGGVFNLGNERRQSVGVKVNILHFLSRRALDLIIRQNYTFLNCLTQSDPRFCSRMYVTLRFRTVSSIPQTRRTRRDIARSSAHLFAGSRLTFLSRIKFHGSPYTTLAISRESPCPYLVHRPRADCPYFCSLAALVDDLCYSLSTKETRDWIINEMGTKIKVIFIECIVNDPAVIKVANT
eukprot:1391893-Amorphochlora_amoeboformis.AAC.1